MIDDGFISNDPGALPTTHFYQDPPLDSADYLDEDRPRPGGTIEIKMPNGEMRTITMPATHPEGFVYGRKMPPKGDAPDASAKTKPKKK